MKPNPFSHRDALDQALRQALGTSQPALRRQALQQAASHLLHPRYLLESPLLTDQHPWRREALAVADALEAVSNGMEEPGVLAALEALGDDSPFLPWREFIFALHFFYEGLDEAVAARVARIPAGSPVAPLGRLLVTLIGTASESLPAGLRPLAESVCHPDPELVQLVQDVAEGLETDDEELFTGALADWLEVVAASAPDRAQAAMIWAWSLLEWRPFDEEPLLDLGRSLWGRSESYRLAALGTVGWDAPGAALLWHRFVISAVRQDGWTEAQAAEAMGWLDRFEAAGRSEGWDEETEETWLGLAASWNAEAQARRWTALSRRRSAEEPPVSLAARPVSDGQLDLFAL